MKRMIHAILMALILAVPSLAATPAKAEAIQIRNAAGLCLKTLGRTDRLAWRYCDEAEDTQKWERVGQQLINVYDERCLDADYARSLTSVHAHECLGTRNQMWSYDSRGRLVNATTGRCLSEETVKFTDGSFRPFPILSPCTEIPAPSGATATTWLRIDHVICISPAGGINDVARFFAAFGGGLTLEPLNGVILGDVAVVLISAATVAVLNPKGVARDGELAGGTDFGEAILVGVDNLFAGADDLFITVNDTKIWPAGRDYADADAGDGIPLGYTTPLTGDIRLELWEDDTFGSDTMGHVTFSPTMESGNSKNVTIVSEEEGSAYMVVYSIYRQ